MNYLLGLGAGLIALLMAGYKIYVKPNMASEDNITTIKLDPPVAPVSPQEPVSVPIVPPDKIKTFAQAQQAFEGYWPGSNSYVHRNPGNCKDIHGNFITFATYEAGFTYLEDYIRRVAMGQHEAYPKGGETTFLEYVHTYTSDGEPAWTNYAAALARALNVPNSTKMSYLLS